MSPAFSNPGRRREVLVVSHYYDSHGGGIERTVRRLIEEIAQAGNFHFTWAASDCPALDGKTDGRSTLNPAEHTLTPMACFNLLEKLTGVPWPIWGWKSLRRLRAAIDTADIVWLHDAPYMGNICAFLMAKRRRKPVVITQHIGIVPYRNPIWRILMAIADRFFTQPMLMRADQTVFVSDWVADNYHRKLNFRVPVRIVPNGVDPEVFYPAPTEQRWRLRVRFALRDTQPVLLFVGRFIEKKGLPVIEKLAELLPDWRFWLVGQGPINPERWQKLNVHVFRSREGAALAELYQAADLLILPSYGEGFPLVIQEAMACGLPVVCGPATAAGSQLARPFLLTALVDSASPTRTANAWAKRIKAQSDFLPLAEANAELAKAAHYFWSWPKIAACYAVIFNDLARRTDA